MDHILVPQGQEYYYELLYTKLITKRACKF